MAVADFEAEHRTLLDGHVVQELIVAVEIHRNVKGVFGRGHAGDVIDVGVCQQNRLNLNVEIAHCTQQLIDFIARVDDHRFARSPAGDDESVLVKGLPRVFNDHGPGSGSGRTLQ